MVDTGQVPARCGYVRLGPADATWALNAVIEHLGCMSVHAHRTKVTELSQLQLALEPHFIFSDSASECFQYDTPCNTQCVSITGQIAGVQFRSVSSEGTIGTGLYRPQTDISELKVGDLVRVQAVLYRHDGYEHQTPVKVYAVLATSAVVECRS
ncbi:hypothetical protein B0H17DRAFT_1123990 [Mycena rosella]|uniref:Uncharacterized protein n=1 Tax=Mycena rosella TaxID=1033263 RepID=A0AAD7H2V5_MYCRO|nr:hypothetical protein B0H17DRAFT_1123990 [Mycena rosella]